MDVGLDATVAQTQSLPLAICSFASAHIAPEEICATPGRCVQVGACESMQLIVGAHICWTGIHEVCLNQYE
jgi:hypothetical protein